MTMWRSTEHHVSDATAAVVGTMFGMGTGAIADLQADVWSGGLWCGKVFVAGIIGGAGAYTWNRLQRWMSRDRTK